MIYRCIENSLLSIYCENGFPAWEFGIIPMDSIWYEDDISMIGGEVHLECESGCDDFGWIEITNEDLQRYFEKVEVTGGKADEM